MASRDNTETRSPEDPPANSMKDVSTTMANKGVLKRLQEVVCPGQALTEDAASHLAGELRKYVEVLESASFQKELANRYKSRSTRTSHKKKSKREMDFSRYHQRYVALELMYIGWDYRGFARQDDTPNTIEGHMFNSLQRTTCIPPESNWEELLYSRCGRTDIGVSAAGQVVTLMVRSKALLEEDLPSVEDEMDYPLLLNKVLPSDIQVTGWTPVPEEFHARFTANAREYKYFISGAQYMNLEAMQTAAKALEGEHDFQNFCKMDLNNTTVHTRKVNSISIEPAPALQGKDTTTLILTVHGRAFLWHQVRCMAAVLIMVGKGQEAPDITTRLLDVVAHPHKPQYDLASELPLLLNRVGFGGGYHDISFYISQRAATCLLHNMETREAKCSEQATLLSAVHDRVKEACREHVAGYRGVQGGHTELMKRGHDPSFAERLAVWHSKGNTFKELKHKKVKAADD